MFTDNVKILIIDDNSPFVLPLVRSFSDYPDIQLDVLVCNCLKPRYFKFSRFLRNVYWEKQLTEEDFEKTVKEYLRRSSADIIISTREWISKLIYHHRHWLEQIVKIHPISDVNTLDTINDKWKLNCWLEKNKFPFSRAMLVGNEPDMNIMVDNLSFPVLLKPLIGIGGTGIKLINSRGDLKSAFESKIYAKDYLIQEFIEGYDIDISFFSINGEILYYTIQKGIILGRLTYSKGIEFVKNQELYDLTSHIVRKLKYSGIAHLDFRFDSKNGTFILIDFNARYWSSLEGSRIMGVNFPLLAVMYTMGIKFSYPDYSTGTYYFAITAIKTFLGNLFSKKKLSIYLHHTELRYIIIDPVPEIVHTFRKIICFIKKNNKRSSRNPGSINYQNEEQCSA